MSDLQNKLSLSQILQVMSVNVFQRVPLAELVAKTAAQNKADESLKAAFNDTSAPLAA